MSEAERAPEASSQKPVPKRSPIERAVVWGGILLLLMVMLYEWRSQSGHNGTIEAFEGQFEKGVTIPIADLEKHAQGYYVRSEFKDGDERVVTLQWPSLFKTYKLYFPVDRLELITSFETEASRNGEVPEAAKKSHHIDPATIDPNQPATPSPTMMPAGSSAPAADAKTPAVEERTQDGNETKAAPPGDAADAKPTDAPRE